VEKDEAEDKEHYDFDLRKPFNFTTFGIKKENALTLIPNHQSLLTLWKLISDSIPSLMKYFLFFFFFIYFCRSTSDDSIMRVYIPNFLAFNQYSQIHIQQIQIFMCYIKYLARTLNGIIMISISKHVLPRKISDVLLYFADTVINFRSFVGKLQKIMIWIINLFLRYRGFLYRF
jgi:hypothetical protein